MTAGCSSGTADRQDLPLTSPHGCAGALHDPAFTGLRLVEAMSYGSGATLCYLAPAGARTADASVVAPVLGRRVAVRHRDGSYVEQGAYRFTRAPVDPGDEGPLVDPE